MFHPHSVGLSAVQGERLTEYSSIMKNKWSDSSVCVHSNLCVCGGDLERHSRDEVRGEDGRMKRKDKHYYNKSPSTFLSSSIYMI